ncbi:hypothetical protein ABG79_01614 [Caloramator mitchellensis]|uniref:Uncharacterized protein n=1 Tax=Caloramator mitchellensis TaxID=908809 RepID=A0A0R3JSX8_CALMK|nr:hypothetical protein [Caloramator mitchellensis]KRQ86631.1 hypothetical protein ABG79_01614 [Caloramator mitchellensis]
MIQIDDAGSGSLVGGTIIGALRVETMEFFNYLIPVKYFKSPYFKQKEYESYTVKLIEKAIKDLNITKYEEIQICRGYLFNKAIKYLTDKGYNATSTKISEPLQSLIEDTFKKYVIDIGIPEDYINFTKYPFHFHKMLRWVLADPKDRIKYCKTGWDSWQKYICNLNLTKSTDYIFSGHYVCLKCGQPIKTPGKIKVIKYTTNKDYFIYLHQNCHFSQ